MESLHIVLQSLQSSVSAWCKDDLKSFQNFFLPRMLWLSSLHVMVPSHSTAFHTLQRKGHFLPKNSFRRTIKKEIQIVSIMLRQYLRSWKGVCIQKKKLRCSCAPFLEVCGNVCICTNNDENDKTKNDSVHLLGLSEWHVL